MLFYLVEPLNAFYFFVCQISKYLLSRLIKMENKGRNKKPLECINISLINNFMHESQIKFNAES